MSQRFVFKTTPVPTVAPSTTNVTRDILRRRMMKPQRHRLLQSFPLAAAMPPAQPLDQQERFLAFPMSPAGERELLVGILPHPFCNPTVRGCGFCTFPHEQFSGFKAALVASLIVKELEQRLDAQPELRGRKVAALYFGGGTANLTPSDSFRLLCRAANMSFDLSEAEVTLEGVPSNFIRRQPLLLDILDEEMAPRHRRISMGIQSFDENRLKQMGRLGYGTGSVFAEVVREAHRRGMTASGDLLFNLPAQSLDEMRSDLRQACDIGLDHIGLYHLVAFRGLKTAWSQDPKLLAQLPNQDQAVENWLALREQLLDDGFVQTSLTNFERSEVIGKANRFQYEVNSFRPDRYEMLGLGPAAISSAANKTFDNAWKTINPEASHDYMAAVNSQTLIPNRVFRYGQDDLKAFYLTRRLSGLAIDTQQYQSLFDLTPMEDYPEEFAAFIDEELIELTGDLLRPTPRGMFFSDSISALLAAPRLSEHRRHGNTKQRVLSEMAQFENDNAHGHM
ncbi:MAG TPA: radical SAM protein [Schlesneria sp.]|jgi:oxygen-independent coproporphyrinogen-3 oxidase